MSKRKLSQKQIKNIQKLLKEGNKPKDLAKKYGVHISVIYRRAKYDYQARSIPIDIKNKLVKAIKDGYTKAEAAQLCGLNIGTVYNLTRELRINGHRAQGNHIVRKNGIKLLNTYSDFIPYRTLYPSSLFLMYPFSSSSFRY